MADVSTVSCSVCGDETQVRTFALSSAEKIDRQLPPGWVVRAEGNVETGEFEPVVYCPNHRPD
jgi:hypothetical protein